MLPAVFGWRGPGRLLLGTVFGGFAAQLALVLGALVGLVVGSFTLGLLIALVPGGGEHAAPWPTSDVMRVVMDGVGDLTLWSGVGAGSAMAAIAAVGLAAAVPGLPRPLLSVRVAIAGACATVLFLPEWDVRALQAPFREPVLLIVAALPALILVNWRSITRSQRAAPR